LALAEIRAGHVESFFADTPWKASTISFYFHSLKKLFGHLEVDRVVERSPFAELPTPRLPRKATSKALKRLKAFLLELDGYDESSDSYRPGLVAMYPVIVGGQDPLEIAEVTGIPLAEVQTYVQRLRENGIWDGERVVLSFDPDGADTTEAMLVVEMVLIIGAAAGIFARVPSEGDAA
jgi:hypothetical protein